jgi:hypothetical protein
MFPLFTAQDFTALGQTVAMVITALTGLFSVLYVRKQGKNFTIGRDHEKEP